jgi:hypothetical protein
MLKMQKSLESNKICQIEKLQDIFQRAQNMHTLEDVGMALYMQGAMQESI